MSRDEVFREPHPQLVDFVFDHSVAAVFPDMIRRSVPGYELVVPLSGLLAVRQVAAGAPARIYDLGCSLGATTLAILRAGTALSVDELRVIGVDNSAPMLERARSLIVDERVEFIEADLLDFEFGRCGGVVMNFVLQFIAPEDRLGLLRRIREHLDPCGALILSEKVRSDDPAVQAFNDAAHLDFKRANGYSELEISQKRSALERVMIVDTIEQHLERFAAAGFSVRRQWYGCLNWASFMVAP